MKIFLIQVLLKKTEQNQEVTIKSVEVSVSRSDIFSEEEEDIFAEK